MIIENPDAFKSWLTSILEPLCDADPAALAKYVYALVKKDKPLEELRDGMLDQLDVFLQQETKQFVDMLFKSLESNDYLKAIEKQASPLPEGTEPEKADAENHPPNGTLEENVVATGGVPRARSPPPAPPAPAHRHRLVVSRARPPHPLLVHRAPPMEHTLVKVLPLTELLEEPVDQPPTRRDRRGETLRDTDERRRRRSRSWERRARPRRHAERRDHDDRRDDRSRRPVSRSPSPRGRYRHRSPPPPAMDRPPSRSRSRSPVPVRDRDHERERDRLRVPREMERDRMSRDREHRDRVSRSRDRDRSRERSRDRSRGSGSPVKEPRLDHSDAYKRRCRDYDEKGYCMRGDLCQWDHGSDPVVLEDAALSRVLAVPPPVPEYNPLTPDIWSASAGFPPYLHPHQHHPPRELIPIPRVRHVAPPPPHAPPPRHPPPNKKNFDYNRTGGPRPPLPAHAANCSLEVKKVPRGLNDITHLNNHFCKFGKIVNIQVCYDGDPEAAMITFSNPTEANIAYKSTEAVLNNRFIKVFWHNPENKQENNIQKANQQTDRQTPQHPMSHNKVLINRENIKATADNKQQAEKLQQQQQQQTKLTETANGQEPKKEAPKPMEKFKKVTEMYKRAQALLDKQLQQQRLLIDKLESGNITTQQKPALMEAINSTHEGIEKLHKEIGAYSKILTQLQTKKPKTREEAQKEILDAELDLFTKQQEGQDVTELMKKIAELRRQMAIQFPSVSTARRTYSRGGRFNTSTRFSRNNAAAPKPFSMNQTVDHRPRALLISGFEADELDALVTHFSQFGAITHKESNLSVPELVVVYSARAHAEHAAVAGKHYNDRTLSVTWVASPKLTTTTNNNEIRQPNTNGDATTNNAKEPEPPQEISEDALLRFDEEDDEDAEDRSWRR